MQLRGLEVGLQSGSLGSARGYVVIVTLFFLFSPEDCKMKLRPFIQDFLQLGGVGQVRGHVSLEMFLEISTTGKDLGI